ncbi:MAG: DivIVA domain-containing protein [Acidimicrobiales bacterium]|jgi:DivIVA domain-containing protein|nr:DivIVA domain-containing protein [Acidimicrobiales bacterium]
MTSSDSYPKKFDKVQRRGYKISEVNQFMEKIAAQNLTETPLVLKNEVEIISFSLTKRKGYSPKQVDDYLDSLGSDLASGIPKSDLEASSSQQKRSSNRSPYARGGQASVQGDPSVIHSEKLRTLVPPIVSSVGYKTEEVDHFLSLVADTLERFENVEGKQLDALRADQYLQKHLDKPLLSGDQIRSALFDVSENGGYGMLGVDAAVNRLAAALDYHWSRTS